jgi:NADPH-dependent curcumin reductase CurA
MRDFGKIALCGVTSTYLEFNKRTGISNTSLLVTKRLLIAGLTFNSHFDR